ncbi:hypothetical protein Tco_1386868 [Tanacetum coccineum]
MVAYLEKSEGSEGFHQIIDFLSASHIKYALTESPTIYASLIEQFWQTAALSTIEDGVMAITATIDRKVKVVITEASIRRHLKLEDSEGLSTLPTEEIFAHLARMGSKKTAWEQFSSNIATAIICLATNRTFNFSKFIFDAMETAKLPHQTYTAHALTQKLFSNMKRVSKGYSGVITPLFDTMLVQHQDEEPSIQPTPESSPSRITSSPSLSPQHTTIAEEAAPMPNESPLQSVHSLGHDEGSSSLHDLMVLCTSLSKKVQGLESELKQTKQTYSTAITKLIKRGRSLIMDAGISLVPPHATDQGRSDDTQVSGQLEEQLGVFSAAKVLADAAEQGKSDEFVQTYTRRSRLVSTADVSTASELVSTAGVKAKDKGKAVMQESEPPKKIKKKVQVQINVDEELAKKMFEEEQARFNAEQEAKFKAEQEQERIDFETTLNLQKQLDERKEVVAQAHDIDWNDPTVLRYHAIQNRSFSKAEVRKNMCMYLKNQGGYKLSYFKGMSYEDIRPIFEKVWDQIHSFVPMDSELKGDEQPIEEEKEKKSDDSSKPAGGSRKKSLARKRAGEKQSEESSKRQKREDDTEKEELKAYLDIVPREEFAMEIESLATKYPIVDWKTHVLNENFMYYQIIRADGSFKNYKIFSEMLDDFDRQDVMDLHRLVEERYATTSPEGYDLMLWGDLKILFQPDEKDEVWRNQNEYNLISWRLFDSCGIHILLMDNGIAIHMMVEKKYPLNQEMISRMLSRRLEVDQESEMAFELLRSITSLEEDCWELMMLLLLKQLSFEDDGDNAFIDLDSRFRKSWLEA